MSRSRKEDSRKYPKSKAKFSADELENLETISLSSEDESPQYCKKTKNNSEPELNKCQLKQQETGSDSSSENRSQSLSSLISSPASDSFRSPSLQSLPNFGSEDSFHSTSSTVSSLEARNLIDEVAAMDLLKLIATIKPFTGKYSDIPRFIESLKYAIEVNQDLTPAAIVKGAIVNTLDKLTYDKIKKIAILTADDLETEMRKALSKNTVPNYTLGKLLQLKQRSGESISDFSERFSKIHKDYDEQLDCSESEEAAEVIRKHNKKIILDSFILGVKPNLMQLLGSKDHDNLAELIAFAISREKMTENNQNNQQQEKSLIKQFESLFNTNQRSNFSDRRNFDKNHRQERSFNRYNNNNNNNSSQRNFFSSERYQRQQFYNPNNFRQPYRDVHGGQDRRHGNFRSFQPQGPSYQNETTQFRQANGNGGNNYNNNNGRQHMNGQQNFSNNQTDHRMAENSGANLHKKN